MTVFLKGGKIWRYVTSSIPKLAPIPKSKATTDVDVSKTTITEDDYEAYLEEWESIQSKILSWFINASVPSVHSLLPRLGIAEVAWIFLSNCYNCTDSSLEFHMDSKLYQMHQETGIFFIIILRLLLCGNNSLLQIFHYCILRTLSSLPNIGTAMNLFISWWVYMRILSLLGLLYLANLLILLLMLQSRSSSPRRTVSLLITCHPLTMCWLHFLLSHNLPLLHSLLINE